MYDISHLKNIKEELKRRLSLTTSEQKSLDDAFSKGAFDPLWTFIGLIICAAIAIACLPTVLLALLFGYFSFWLLKELITGEEYKKKKADALKQFTRGKFEWVLEDKLKRTVSQLPLASLRDVKASVLVEANIPDIDNSDRQGYQLCSGVFIKYRTITLRIKCDFRVIRNCMTREQVSWIYKRIAETCPAADPKTIEVVQYSSTKHFSFKKDYVDAGTINSFYSKRSTGISSSGSPSLLVSRVTTIQNGSSLRESSSTNQSSRVSSKVTTSTPKDDKQFNAQKRLKILLSGIVEKRKAVEEFAMEVVMSFEEMKGRTPEDVSKLNYGYDIISKNGISEARRIEVKGLSTQGDVTITENELKAAEKHKQSFFLYILDNCAANDKKSLYILRGLKEEILNTLKKEVAEYSISYEEQEKAVDAICYL